MAFVNWPGWPWKPASFGNANGVAFGFGAAITMDASGESVGWVIEAPKAGTINRVGFRVNTVGNAPDNGLRVGFYSLASGLPNAETHFRVIPPAVAAGWQETGLVTTDGTDTGTKKTVTRGERFAVTVDFESFAVGDSLNINNSMTGSWVGAGFARGFPYGVSDVGAGWVKNGTNGDGLFVLAIQYDDSVWCAMPGCAPIATVPTATTLNSAANPDEVGNIFNVLVPLRVSGFEFPCALSAATADMVVRLYDEDDVVLASATLNEGSDQLGGATGAGQVLIGWFDEDVELKVDENYRLVIEGTGAGNVVIYSARVSANTYLSAMPYGSTFNRTERNNGGVWSDSTVDVMLLHPVFNGNQLGAPRARYILGGI